jgi:DNA repair protein RadC
MVGCSPQVASPILVEMLGTHERTCPSRLYSKVKNTIIQMQEFKEKHIEHRKVLPREMPVPRMPSSYLAA